MPSTSSGRAYTVRDRKGDAKCVVCGTWSWGTNSAIYMRLTAWEPQGVYAFPVCSLVCIAAWTELLDRCLDNDAAAITMALAYLAEHDKDG